MSKLKLHILASGSKGNCSIVENAATGECVAVDCGISWRAFRERCEECSLDPARVNAVLVTHEHTDHTKGLGVMTRGLAKLGASPVIYASEAVLKASGELRKIQDAIDLRHFSAGDFFELGDTSAYAFHTSHDAVESFGFRFDSGHDSIGFMTDTGVVTGEAYEALQRCRVLAIEANHDVDMLAKGPYPYYLKARVAGEHGHLSNAQSAELLESLLDDCVEYVVAMHISQNNNTYTLPQETLASALKRKGHAARALVGFQDRPVTLG